MATTTTTATKTNSQPIRLDLKPRMAGGRRLPRPDASLHLAAPAPNVEQNPQLFLTYSQFLRNFDATPISFNEDYRHRPSFAISPFSEPFSGPEPGPSSRHSGFYPSDRHQDLSTGPGWRRDVFDREPWLGRARIEEVDDDGDKIGPSVRKSNTRIEDNLAPPRVQSISTAFVSSKDDEVSISSQDDMPLDPPPGPRLRTFPSFKPTSPISEYHSLQATSTASAIPQLRPPLNANTPTSTLDDATEVSVVREVLNLLIVSQEDVKFMNTFFLAKSREHEHEVSQHIDLCTKMEESLASLRTSLDMRTAIGAEEWNVRSPSWHQKYCKRLVSLRITLKRLSKMRELVQTHALHFRHKHAVIEKLEQHEAKLTDLASKFTIAFDRLRLRHLHFLLTRSHEEAKRQKDMKRSRMLSRASFERRWKEGKTLRQTLRVNFNDLRQEFYHNAQRNPRHPSAP